MDKFPLVSIVVATYKRDIELKRAILSLLDQTYKNIEIVIVSDNANPVWNIRISEIISELNDEKKITLIINKDNIGSAKTRNVGIEYSKGEYITFLDDDDEYLKEKIEAQVVRMINDNSDFSITNMFLYNRSGKLVDKRCRKGLDNKMNNASLLNYHLKYHLTGTMTFMFKKKYLLEINAFDEIDLGDEFYLMEKAIVRGGKLAYYNHCYVKAYLHDSKSGVSSGLKKIQGEKVLLTRKLKYEAVLNKKDVNFIWTRHYLVLSYTYLRMHRFFKFIYYLIKSIVNSPYAFFYLLRSR